MEASNSSSPCGKWQPEHWASDACGRFTWLAPVAKLISSWQEPHAARLGLVNQLSACVAPVVACGSWHSTQRGMFTAAFSPGMIWLTEEGNTTVDQSETAWLNPMTWYGVPALTLGRVLPS